MLNPPSFVLDSGIEGGPVGESLALPLSGATVSLVDDSLSDVSPPISGPDVVNGGGVTVGVDEGPNTRLPEPRSSPMMLKCGLLAPKPTAVPGLRLNQHGVAEVKLSRMGTVAL